MLIWDIEGYWQIAGKRGDATVIRIRVLLRFRSSYVCMWQRQFSVFHFFPKDLLSISSLFHLICSPHLLLRGHVVAPLHHPIVVAQSRAVPAGTRAKTNSHRRRFHRSTCLPIWTPPHPTPGRAGSAVRMPHNTPVDEYRACRRVKVDRRRAVVV